MITFRNLSQRLGRQLQRSIFLLLTMLLVPGTAMAQVQFLEPTIPSDARQQAIESVRPQNQFGISPHLASYRPGLGVQQTGQSLESIDGVPARLTLDDDLQNSDLKREVIRQRYADGKVQIEREVAQDSQGNYFNHGSWRVKSPKGDVVAEGQYYRGLMHGVWERKHTQSAGGLFAELPFKLFDDPITSTATFKRGKLDGLWTLSDRFNRKIFEVSYVDGVRHGTATWWYPSTLKMREVNFNRGVINGRLQEWDQQSKLTRNDQYVAGKKVVRQVTSYRPKQLKSEDYFLDAKLELNGQDNWWAAEPAPMMAVGKRVQHGQTRSWYDNGQPKMKGQYDNNQRTGQFAWWHANGNKKLQGNYEAGSKTGRWTWWHGNGMKSIEGHYQNGQPVGIWKWWQADGQVKATENVFSTCTRQLRKPSHTTTARHTASKRQPTRRNHPPFHVSLRPFEL